MIPVKYIKCNLCGANDFKVIFPSNLAMAPATVEEYTSTGTRYASHHDIVKCDSCGLIYMNPRDSNVFSLYEKVVDESYLETWNERAATFQRHLQVLQRFKPDGRLLDMGCYAGIFIGEAQKKGYHASGIEPSRWASSYAHQRTGANIVNGGCQERQFDDRTFEIITLWDVIEHLEDPSQVLALAHDYLDRDGMIAITTHDIESFPARIMKKRYPWLMRFHLYHFTPQTLKAMLLKNGFEPFFLKYYSKRFSLSYLLSRFGIRTSHQLFRSFIIPVNTFDGFIILARKIPGKRSGLSSVMEEDRA